MIDCSLHGAMMSKHKVPTSFRPPSLRPQVYIIIYIIYINMYYIFLTLDTVSTLFKTIIINKTLQNNNIE